MAKSAEVLIGYSSKCPNHPDEGITGYCVDHGVNYCGECAEIHRSCKDTIQTSGTETFLFEKYADVCTGVGNEQHVGDSVGDNTIRIQELKKVSSELNHAMKEQEIALLNSRVSKTTAMETIDNAKRLIEKTFIDYDKHIIEKIDHFKKRRDMVEIMINTFDKSYQNMHDLRKASKLLVKQSRDDIENMETLDPHDSKSAAIDLGDGIKDLVDRTLRFSTEPFKEIAIKQIDDKKKCTVMGMCFVENSETLFITDWENEKLKRIDTTYIVCESLEFPNYVCDVVQTDLNELAVTMPLVHTVRFVNINGKMEHTRYFKVGDTDADICRALCYCDNKIIVNCGGHEKADASVKIFSKQGALLQVIKKTQEGRDLFVRSTDIVVSNRLEQIFVTDEENGILAFTKHCQYTKTLNVPDIRHPTGIYPFMDCWLFVCCYDTNKVHLVHKDGLEARVFVSENEGIKLPLSPCFDSKRSKLFVEMKGNDIVPVFDVKKSL